MIKERAITLLEELIEDFNDYADDDPLYWLATEYATALEMGIKALKGENK